MSFEILECSIAEIATHPRLENRVNARVKVRLRERRQSQTNMHNVVVRVGATTEEGMYPDDVRDLLLRKAATILHRAITTIEAPSGEKDSLPADPAVTSD